MLTPPQEWTPDEIEQLIDYKNNGWGYQRIGLAMGRSSDAVRSAWRRAERDRAGRQVRIAVTDGVDDVNTVEYWKARTKELQKELSTVARAETAVDILAGRIVEMAPKSYQTRVPTPVPRKTTEGQHGQSVVLMLSDTHVGKVVEPNQTLGFGEYNTPVFLNRLERLEEAVVSIITGHVQNPQELVIAMLGDMLDGQLQHGSEIGQKVTLVDQLFIAGHALAQFLARVATQIEKVRVVCVVGNHTRWATQKKMPTEQRYSNFDMLLYLYVQSLTREVSNIEWQINQQPFQLFELHGYVFYCAHGDHLRGGDKALGIPAHALGRQLSVNTQLFRYTDQKPPNYYLFAHLHRHIEIPHAGGQIIVNGAFPGLDGYSLTEAFNPCPPTQVLFTVHPKWGRAANYPLRLDIPPEGDNPYVIPPFGSD